MPVNSDFLRWFIVFRLEVEFLDSTLKIVKSNDIIIKSSLSDASKGTLCFFFPWFIFINCYWDSGIFHSSLLVRPSCFITEQVTAISLYVSRGYCKQSFKILCKFFTTLHQHKQYLFKSTQFEHRLGRF